MVINKKFGKALQRFRKFKGMTQEDFSSISSRTYISSLERGTKGPTLEKINDLATHIGVHPLSIVALAYMSSDSRRIKDKLLKRVNKELSDILG